MSKTEAALVQRLQDEADLCRNEGADDIARLLDEAVTALSQAEAAQEPAQWVPVAERRPPSGQVVLACYMNRAGRLRRIRAQWIAAKSREANSDDSDIGVYDEATDTFYDPEGWYERIDNWGDYSAVMVCEGEPTHWMPLPPAPESA
jgi:hypothetical protein